jgi:uncharacterized protein (UPF0548 family)
MIFQLFFPSSERLDALKKAQQYAPLTYPKTAQVLSAFDYDDNRVLLGEGTAVFEAAKEAIRRWAMFEGKWARIYSDTTPIEKGQIVIMCARAFGFWWLNAARIVYTVNEPRAFGFAYGTLTHHIESGEELFQVEMDDYGKVWYRIKAFSRPRYWMVRIGYPFARMLQRRFIRDSFKSMKKITNEIHAPESPLALAH